MNDPQTNENPGPQATQAKPGPTNAAPGAGQSSDQTQPGQGTLAPLPDNEQIIKRTPEDTRTYLRKAAERLEKERRSNAELLAGPDRKGVRDW